MISKSTFTECTKILNPFRYYDDKTTIMRVFTHSKIYFTPKNKITVHGDRVFGIMARYICLSKYICRELP